MKKFINLTLLFIGIVFFNSCSKEDIPMTSTVDLAGEWMVTVDVIDGDEVYEDGYGLGQMLWITYNTNADNGKEIWIDALDNLWAKYLWKTKVKTSCDVNALTFGSDTPIPSQYYDDCNITLTDGKVTFGGAVTPSGMPADKIEFYLTYSDDEDGYVYYVHGYRRTGFVADE